MKFNSKYQKGKTKQNQKKQKQKKTKGTLGQEWEKKESLDFVEYCSTNSHPE